MEVNTWEDLAEGLKAGERDCVVPRALWMEGWEVWGGGGGETQGLHVFSWGSRSGRIHLHVGHGDWGWC